VSRIQVASQSPVTAATCTPADTPTGSPTPATLLVTVADEVLATRKGRAAGDLRPLAALFDARAALPEGDFRDWPEIDDWAAGIARELATAA